MRALPILSVSLFTKNLLQDYISFAGSEQVLKTAKKGLNIADYMGNLKFQKMFHIGKAEKCIFLNMI